MKKIVFPALLFGALMVSCKNDKNRAFEFNQQLAAISETLFSKGKQLGQELSKISTHKDFTQITVIGNDLKNFISEKIATVKDMKNTGGSEKLKAAMLEFLNYEKDLVHVGVGPFMLMTENTSDDKIQEAIQIMVQKSERESGYLEKLQEAQKEYAERNGFKISEK